MYYRGKPGFVKEQVWALEELERNVPNADQIIDLIIRTGYNPEGNWGSGTLDYDTSQIWMLGKSFSEGVPLDLIAVFSKPDLDNFAMMYTHFQALKGLDAKQLEQIVLGFQQGLNAKQIDLYSDPSIHPYQMQEIRLLLRDGPEKANKRQVIAYLETRPTESIEDALEKVGLKPTDKVVQMAIQSIAQKEDMLFKQEELMKNEPEMQKFNLEFNNEQEKLFAAFKSLNDEKIFKKFDDMNILPKKTTGNEDPGDDGNPIIGNQ